MDYFQYAFNILIVLVIVIGIVKVFMWVANDVGDKLGVAKFIMNLWQNNEKIRIGKPTRYRYNTIER